MKRIVLLLVCLLSLSMVFAAFDKNESDRLFYVENDYEADFAYLTKSLQSAVTNEEKAEILWRMSRTRLTLTDENKESMTEDERLSAYGDYGANDKPKSGDTSSAFYYAYESLKYYETPNAYHWKASAVGRAGQEHGALNSLGKADPMRKLETKALEEFSSFPLETDSWYVLAILYRSLPGKPISFGNDNIAISYMRKCLMTQDMERTNGTNYLELAEELYKRDWDAKKRAKEFQTFLKNWEKNHSKGYTEYNKYYEGYLDTQGSPFWVAADLNTISDRQEAIALLQYGISVIDWKYTKVTGELRKAKLEKEREKLEAKLKEWT